MKSPAVSIIVPVYNVERYINRCIDSLISQTLYNIEIILVDDESPDNCANICDEYAKKDSRIKVIHKKNGGLGFARNSGLEIARGKYVAFVDSDDFVDINMYKILYKTAIENKLDTVLSGYNKVQGEYVLKKFPGTDCILSFRGKNDTFSLLIDMIGTEPNEKKDFKFEMSVWRGLYLREILEKYTIRFPSEREFISEDIIFHIKYFSHASSVDVLPNCFYNYSVNPNSLTMIYNPQRFEKNKTLYLEVKRLLKEIYGYTESAKVDRMFLSRVRATIYQAVNNISQVGYSEVKKNIIAIRRDIIFEKVLAGYYINKMPFKKKLFFLLLKYKQIGMVVALVKIKNKVVF